MRPAIMNGVGSPGDRTHISTGGDMYRKLEIVTGREVRVKPKTEELYFNVTMWNETEEKTDSHPMIRMGPEDILSFWAPRILAFLYLTSINYSVFRFLCFFFYQRNSIFARFELLFSFFFSLLSFFHSFSFLPFFL